MKIKYLFLLTLSAMLLASCVKDPDDPEPTPQDMHYSIIGDSYSTFQGYLEPDTNTVWPFFETIGLTTVEQTWWKQVEKAMDWTLEQNNSYSGSLISNYYLTPPSFLKRMGSLGNPDVIFIFGGTNDVWYGAPLGEYVYEAWSDEQLRNFRPALAFLFITLKEKYPEAQIYFLLDMNLGVGDSHFPVTTEVSDTYKESIREITDHCGINLIRLYNIHKNWSHPDVEGMKNIADQVIAALRAEEA